MSAVRIASTLLLTACTQSGTVLSGMGGGGEGGGQGGGGEGGLPFAFLDALAVGPNHSCSLSEGSLVCWGDGDSGALGTGDEVDRNTPTTIDAGDDWVEITAGALHSCGLRKGGSLWCWGDNAEGQLGNGTNLGMLEPTFVSTSAPAVQLASTYAHSCALFADRSLWCWGANEEGQLAQGDPFSDGMNALEGVDRNAPVQVGTDRDWLAVDAGQGHSCGIRGPGSLWCWGRNSEGQLGLGPGAPGQIRLPDVVSGEPNWTEVRTGQTGTCGLRGVGELWCFGDNGFGSLGTGDTTNRLSPERIGGDDDWSGVSVDTFHSCGIRRNGDLYCWGRNDEGQLGTGDNEVRLSPTQVGKGSVWIAVSAGRFFTCARRADAAVFCSGDNMNGELGNGTFDRSNVFVPVAPTN